MKAKSHARLASFLIATGVMMLAFLSAGNASPLAAQAPTPTRAPISPALQAQCIGAARAAVNPRTGNVRFIGADSARPVPRAYLATCGSILGLRDQAQELTVAREKTIARGRSVVRFRQTFRGVPVLGGEVIAQLDGANNILAITSEILPGIDIATTPTVSSPLAQLNVLQTIARAYQLNPSDLTTTSPELWIYNPGLLRPGSGATELVWRMEVSPKTLLPIRELVLVNAQRGNITLHFNQIDFAKNRETYTANNGATLPGTLVCNESNPTCTGGDSHAVAAHIYAGDTYDFYLATHNRDSIDNPGVRLDRIPKVGSPPRVWGIRVVRERRSRVIRFTPTRVGNTSERSPI